ncbi:MAG: hypothetical protein ACLGI3_11065, partial [Actinomycetes bacterium]
RHPRGWTVRAVTRFTRPDCAARWYLSTMSSDYVIGRRAGADGRPSGERHAVVAAATRKEPPFRAECGAEVDVVDGDWPPEGGEEHACPVCVRDTGAPWT